jgi:hypothetical protein
LYSSAVSRAPITLFLEVNFMSVSDQQVNRR